MEYSLENLVMNTFICPKAYNHNSSNESGNEKDHALLPDTYLKLLVYEYSRHFQNLFSW